MKCCFTIICVFISLLSFSQKLPSVKILQDSINSSFRGLSVPSGDVIWVSGSNGTVGRSTDAGKTWQWIIVPGFEKRDFRDIEAFDSLTAVIMAVDNPGNILKTTDGGKNWKVVFHKEQEGMFLDAMHFDGQKGMCIGDPIRNDTDSADRFYILLTDDLSESWFEYEADPFSGSGEAIFAASGSNIVFKPDAGRKIMTFITGGSVSNIIYLNGIGNSSVVKIPIIQGRQSSGAFSITLDQQNSIYITGGDYNEYWKDSGNVVYSYNWGKTWQRSSVHGYRSCIIHIDKKTFITCGTNGVDISFNGCKTFHLIHGDGARGKDGFNVCAKSKTGKAVYFAGTGRIGKLIP